MSDNQIELLVLDVHGVVLSDYFPTFLGELAMQSGQLVEQVRRRWREELRSAAWRGEIGDTELWRRLSDGADKYPWQLLLESGYRLGPAAPELQRWSARAPAWLLSNHRTHWLLPRLLRFGIDGHWERVLVSDGLGAVKPEARAFGPILERVNEPSAVLFVDDHACNIEAAQRLGFQVVHASDEGDWIAQIDARLCATDAAF